MGRFQKSVLAAPWEEELPMYKARTSSEKLNRLAPAFDGLLSALPEGIDSLLKKKKRKKRKSSTN